MFFYVIWQQKYENKLYKLKIYPLKTPNHTLNHHITAYIEVNSNT